MIQQIKSAIQRFLKWVRYLFWTKPAVEPLKAIDDVQNWIVINYNGQNINLRISEVEMWNNLSRFDRRAMARKSKMQEKKGIIRFEKIEGKLICIKNRKYQELAEKAKQK
jgi:hypothetical protein